MKFFLLFVLYTCLAAAFLVFQLICTFYFVMTQEQGQKGQKPLL